MSSCSPNGFDHFVLLPLTRTLDSGPIWFPTTESFVKNATPLSSCSVPPSSSSKLKAPDGPAAEPAR
jgi:hypothetical protein